MNEGFIALGRIGRQARRLMDGDIGGGRARHFREEMMKTTTT